MGSPQHVAQIEENERAPEEILDPLAPVRQAQWDAAIATLREIDPKNPNLTRQLTIEIVRRLYERGLRAGDYRGADFEYWPDQGCQAMVERIEREWIKAGADPNLAEPICWFALRPK